MCFYSFIFFVGAQEQNLREQPTTVLDCWCCTAFSCHSVSLIQFAFTFLTFLGIPHPEIPSAASACSTKHSLILSPFQGRHPLSNPSWQYQLGYHRRCILKNYSFSHSFMSVFCLKYRCTTSLTWYSLSAVVGGEVTVLFLPCWVILFKSKFASKLFNWDIYLLSFLN